MTQTTQGLKSCEKLMVTWRPTHRDTGFPRNKVDPSWRRCPEGGPNSDLEKPMSQWEFMFFLIKFGTLINLNNLAEHSWTILKPHAEHSTLVALAGWALEVGGSEQDPSTMAWRAPGQDGSTPCRRYTTQNVSKAVSSARTEHSHFLNYVTMFEMFLT